MTNEELKEKIVGIIRYCYVNEKDYGYIFDLHIEKKINAIADALIAAGIGDVSEFKNHRLIAEYSLIPEDNNAYILPNTPIKVKQLYNDEEVEEIAKERDELKVKLRDRVDYIHEQDKVIKDYKHRAEVAERAFRNFLAEYFTAVNEQNSYNCGIPEMCGWYANVLPYEDIVTSRLNKYLDEAEKELAEEGKE